MNKIEKDTFINIAMDYTECSKAMISAFLIDKENDNEDMSEFYEDNSYYLSALYESFCNGRKIGIDELIIYLKGCIEDQDAITGQFLHNLIQKYLKGVTYG